MQGELIKLKIEGYKSNQFEEDEEVVNGKFKVRTFETLINPENFTISYKTKYALGTPNGSSGEELQFSGIEPQVLSLNILFDSTGVIPKKVKSRSSKDDRETGIEKDLEKFKEVVFDYQGSSHQPHYLKVSWGVLLFKGCMTGLDIEYKLFNANGAPLRAMAKLEIKDSIEEELRAAKDKKSSPDLTHVREVKAGDTLPLMTYRIYGDSKYYLEVARVNKILNFRKLSVGQQIFFPPIRK